MTDSDGRTACGVIFFHVRDLDHSQYIRAFFFSIDVEPVRYRHSLVGVEGDDRVYTIIFVVEQGRQDFFGNMIRKKWRI